MRIGQLARWHSDERRCGAWLEVNAGDRGVLRGIEHEEPIVSYRDQCSEKLPVAIPMNRIVDPKLVLAEVDYELGRSARQDLFSGMRGKVAAEPKSIHEFVQRRAGPVADIEHCGPRL